MSIPATIDITMPLIPSYVVVATLSVNGLATFVCVSNMLKFQRKAAELERQLEEKEQKN